MQFAFTAAFWGLLTLLIPLAIHLLNRKRGRVVRIGSLAHLEKTESVRARTLRLEEPGLLMLRCVLLILVVLLLAEPFIMKQLHLSEQRGRVLVSPTLADGRSDALQRELESLSEQGMKLYLLAPGFPPFIPGDTVPQQVHDHWSLAREAAMQWPAQQIHIFSEGRQNTLSGNRPRLNVQWHNLPTELANSWIQNAWMNTDGTFQVRMGYSEASGSSFEDTVVGSMGNDRFRVQPEGEGYTLAPITPDLMPDDDSVWVAATKPIHVLLVSDPATRAEDTAYVERALEVTADRNKALVLHSARIGELRPDLKPHLIFYLAEDPIPEMLVELAEQGATLITDSGNAPYSSQSGPMIMPDYPVESVPHLERRSARLEQGTPVWTDVYGVPLLEAIPMGAGRKLAFASRFHPQWNQLTLHPRFPEWISELVTAHHPGMNSAETIASDLIGLPAEQAAPTQIGSEPIRDKRKQPISGAFWMLAVAGFVVERWWSERRRP